MAKDHPEQDEFGDEQPRPSPRLAATSWMIPVLILMLIFSLFWLNSGPARTRIDYNVFLQQLRDGNIVAVEVFDQRAIGSFKSQPDLPPMVVDGKLVQPEKTADGKPKKANIQFEVTLPKSDSAAYDELKTALASVPHKFAPQYDLTVPVLVGTTFVTILLFVLFWLWLRRTQNQMMGGGFLSGFTRSPAKRYEASRQAITFQDVAGLEGVKADLQELVEFLKNPKKFQKLGGRVPKGCCCRLPEPARRCWRGRLPARRACRSSRSTARSSSRCSSASAPAGSAICSGWPKRPRRRSSSSTRSTPSAGSAGRGSAAATTSGSRRSIRSSARWTASRRRIL
jgi:hypothetical protein